MKFGIEKYLHEIIRNLPSVKKDNDLYEQGLITAHECLALIVNHVGAEKIAAGVAEALRKENRNE